MANYDVIIIGAGPGGYVSAIRCAQLGLKTAVVEGRETLGGTCLNVGCIPSKALLHATHMLHEAEHNFADMGLKGKSPSVDWKQMQAYKDDVIGQNTGGIEFLFKKNKIDWIKGWATIPAPGKVQVGDDVHETKNIVIASGSEPASIPGVEIDENRIVSSTGALTLPKVPKKMIVIGAGVIGLELGSVYQRLGAEVTVVEYMDAVCPGMDADVQRTFKRILEKQGLNIITGAAVKSAEALKSKAKVTYAPKKGGDDVTIEADYVLVATGRKPFADGLGLDALGLQITERGQIAVDSHWKTNIDGIYAIGDVTPGPMLAHKAEDEGMAVAEVLAGKHGHVNYGVIPGVVYTTPEVATVGQTEAELKAAGMKKPKVGKFMFMGNARAKAVHQGDGFVKLIVHPETDRVLGAAIIGPAAGDMIHEICVAMEFGASAEDIALTCHAHPTYSEAVREAALACGNGAIHS
ncbi:dihydrolipoyl dehydrogenase [Alisedimentitalea sp. MJ-SS2]|uniref:dihydrolipoyl dehydrogenase n=1 Tax=Aliisedimentitalea sp. MJ-SS2 TaxID=3049795 RepID=UPI00290CF0F1|nr:dihydrolipoyl dehydrogenase [Alisedimentitalea sp. MJ-SS2]MDU8926145.1 dihydrolipoyl dehydrogenase [Alisedimentitalea sp. MJ-SS2]